MSDTKSLYSGASYVFTENDVRQSEIDAQRFLRSKKREELFNDNWKRNPVNINDVVARFAPDAVGRKQGVKFIFEGSRYSVKADMASGYLRIYDKVSKSFVTLDGTPCNDRSLTHFKILKREEM